MSDKEIEELFLNYLQNSSPQQLSSKDNNQQTEKLSTRKYDGSKDYRTIIEKKEEVFLCIG